MPLLLVALAVGVPVGLLWYYSQERGNNSALGGSDYVGSPSAAGELADSVGWPYWYGKGSPSTPWANGPQGVDCSGYVCMCLVKLGQLSANAPDMGARTLADQSYPVDVGEQVPGDMAYYPGHVVMVVGYPEDDGHSAVIGASGHSTTFGDVANECVKVHTTALYRPDFVTYMRLKSAADRA